MSRTVNSYLHSHGLTVTSPIGLHFFFTLELNLSVICSQVGGCSAEGTAPGWFHPPCTSHCLSHKCTARSHAEPSLNTVRQGLSTHMYDLPTHMYDLDAGVWILDSQCKCLNWNFHSRYPCLRFVYIMLFQGLWLATFLRVATGADLATTVNSKGERSIVRLAECLRTVGAQDDQITIILLPQLPERTLLLPVHWKLAGKCSWMFRNKFLFPQKIILIETIIHDCELCSDLVLTTFLESWSGGELYIASCRYGQLEIAILQFEILVITMRYWQCHWLRWSSTVLNRPSSLMLWNILYGRWSAPHITVSGLYLDRGRILRI
jgi:hypothetical protein